MGVGRLRGSLYALNLFPGEYASSLSALIQFRI